VKHQDSKDFSPCHMHVRRLQLPAVNGCNGDNADNHGQSRSKRSYNFVRYVCHESWKMVGISSERKLRVTLGINIVEAETEYFPPSHD